MKCPCGRDKEYNMCCGLAHQHISNASTAEDLMRSRYTAFVMANGEYLMKSHHSSTQPKSEKEIIDWAKSIELKKLEIVSSTEGGENDAVGTVKFRIHIKENRRFRIITEDSKFVREFGHWVYLGFNT